jgi:hypothetical protein
MNAFDDQHSSHTNAIKTPRIALCSRPMFGVRTSCPRSWTPPHSITPPQITHHHRLAVMRIMHKSRGSKMRKLAALKSGG